MSWLTEEKPFEQELRIIKGESCFCTSREFREVDSDFFFSFVSMKQITLFINLCLEGGIFSSFSGIYRTIYDDIVGNVLKLLSRFPKGKVHLRSAFVELCKIWGVGTDTAVCQKY